MRQRLAITLTAIGCVLSAGIGPAAASVTAGAPLAAARRVGLAGYHFRVGRGTTSLTVKGAVTVPTATCGAKARLYQLQIGVGFKVASQTEDATVLLLLKCRNGRARAGLAQLVAGRHVIMPSHPVKPGDTIQIRVAVKGRRSVARVIYADHTAARVSAAGGQPKGAAYALTLPKNYPPKYAPIAFAACTVNGKPLSSVNLKAWESVTSAGKVDGRVSPISANGDSFTITK